MAYLVVNFKGTELGRQTLRGGIIIGRSPECDVTVRDIQLSRRHCRIEARGSDWVITDLGSKNGTFVQTAALHRRVAQHLLRDGELLRIGNTTIAFHRGNLEGLEANWQAQRRPVDPRDALAATVVGKVYHRPYRLMHVDRKLPTPRPVPRDPVSYDREGVQMMVHDLVSSSWDSIYEGASQRPRPERPPPRPMVGAGKVIAAPPATAKVVKEETALQASPIASPRFGWPRRIFSTAVRLGIFGHWIAVLAIRFGHHTS